MRSREKRDLVRGVYGKGIQSCLGYTDLNFSLESRLTIKIDLYIVIELLLPHLEESPVSGRKTFHLLDVVDLFNYEGRGLKNQFTVE